MHETLDAARKANTLVYIHAADGTVSHGTISDLSSRGSSNGVVKLVLAAEPPRQRTIALAHIVSVTVPLDSQEPTGDEDNAPTATFVP